MLWVVMSDKLLWTQMQVYRYSKLRFTIQHYDSTLRLQFCIYKCKYRKYVKRFHSFGSELQLHPVVIFKYICLHTPSLHFVRLNYIEEVTLLDKVPGLHIAAPWLWKYFIDLHQFLLISHRNSPNKITTKILNSLYMSFSTHNSGKNVTSRIVITIWLHI